ncbi:MAG: YggS family pyridoxal phosphate-dependent enzyme [Myxococcales bacterium]|nr:YggS family pyridoxal phosphate-dependent enzyme [Myxococcales bacterium]MCB9708771.1 YggS family pyridoxal phosphate-dependent enzyme [Myxococcales bacterium]
MACDPQRLERVQRNIRASLAKDGRALDDVVLIAVSKGHPPETIREAYGCGLRDFGENYAQELRGKAEVLADLPELRWHMIGHVQGNKVKVLAPLVTAVHTVDSLRLLSRLDAARGECDRCLEVFIQVNLSRETQKSGCPPENVGEIIDGAARLANVEVVGLMLVPARAELGERRASFRELRELAEQHGLSGLSMGMSEDYEVALKEGATHVRVGQALFGPRP